MLSKRQTDRQTNFTKRVYLSNPVKIGTEKKNFEFPHQKNQINNQLHWQIYYCSSGCRGTAKEQVCMNPSLLFQEIGSTGIWKALELRTWLQDCQKKRKYFRIKNNSRSFSASHLPSSLHGVFSSSDMDRVDILHLLSR